MIGVETVGPNSPGGEGGKMAPNTAETPIRNTRNRSVGNGAPVSEVSRDSFIGESLIELGRKISYLSACLRERLLESTECSRNRRDENVPILRSLQLADQCAADIIMILKAMRGSAPVESRKRFSAKISNIRARSVYGLLLPSDTARFQLITEREREVMRLLVSNETNKQVAFDLHISVRTVEIHRRRIMEKLGLHSIGELVHLAIRNGIVEA